MAAKVTEYLPRWAGPVPSWVDAAWWEVLGSKLRGPQMTREAWIDTLALAWCLVRRPESLDPVQLEQQQDMVDRLTGRQYLTTVPIMGWYGEDNCPACQRWREIREAINPVI